MRTADVTVGCVLKTGGEYIADHVGALNYGLKKHSHGEAELVCYTDVPDEVESLGVRAVPLLRNRPGWWSVPEVFRETGKVVVVGLDTVFVRDIRPLLAVARTTAPDQFWMIRNLGKGKGPASGIMVWNGDWSWMFDEFNYQEVSKRLRGDENYTIEALAERDLKPSILQKSYHGDFHGGPMDDGTIVSYKQEVRGQFFPEDAIVVVFHGSPRPHEVHHAWRRANYPLKGERGR